MQKTRTALLLLPLSLALFSGTYGMFRASESWTEKLIQEEFSSTAENAGYLLRQRVENLQEIMRGAKGLYDVGETVGRDDWQTYFKTIGMADMHPEIYAVSYIERVKKEDKEAFIDGVRHDTSTRAAGYPDFVIFPESQKDEYFVVKYSEPPAIEKTALGFDVSSDAVRFRALAHARDTGEITMTPFIKFITGESGPSIYLPVYRKGASLDTVEERRDALTGFIVSGLSIPRFFQEVFRNFRFPNGFSIRICQHGVDGADRVVFYDSITKSNITEGDVPSLYFKTDTLEVGGQMWQLESTATSAFNHSAQILPLIVLGVGIVVSLLFLGIVLLVVASYKRMFRKGEEYAQELRSMNQFLDSIIENIPDMIFVKDAKELRFVRFNKAGEDLLGYHRSELIGKNDYDFFPKNEADFFIAKDREVLDQGTLLDIPMEPIQTRHKGERILHTKKIPLLDDGGKSRYLLGISEDITERQRDEKAKAEFVTMVSHQLRTPLAAMRWSFEILKERMAHFSETERRLANQSYVAMLSMSKTIDTMLAIAHIDTGKIIVNLSEICLADILKSLTDAHGMEAAVKNLHLTLDVSGDCCIKSDANLLREIFSNLLSNAIQYTPDGGSITVRLRKEEKEVVVAVTDTGIGIPANELLSVFEKLFRAENAKKVRAGGSGLGLYVVRSLLTYLGGTVSVTSREGKGSTFTVRLPLLPPV